MLTQHVTAGDRSSATRSRAEKCYEEEREKERGRERERTAGKGGEGGGLCTGPSSSWSRPRRGTALNPIKFLTGRRLASAAEDRPNCGIDEGQVRGETTDALGK